MNKNTNIYKLFWEILIAVSTSIICAATVFASEKISRPAVTSYVIEDKDNFDIEKGTKVTSLPFGTRSLGDLTISGPVEKETTYNHKEAYGVTDPVTFSYTYYGDYNTRDEEEWTISNYLKVNNYIDSVNVLLPMSTGVVVFQKSQDGENWINATDPICDAFKKDNSENPVSYTTEFNDIKNGSYYRVIVAYQLQRKADAETLSIIPQYEYKNCVEEYEFFVSSEGNYVALKDIESKKDLGPISTVKSGFCVDNGGSEAEISVIKDTNRLGHVDNYDSFTDPGEYTVEVLTKLSKKYVYKVNVSEGLTWLSLTPTVFESKKNTGFTMDNPVGSTAFNSSSYTVAKIAQTYGKDLTKTNKNSIPSYGTRGSNVSILLKLKYGLSLTNNGQEVSFDKWGKGKSELIEGVNVGQIGTGALIVQTSKDGEDWETEDLGRYSKGLNTSDYGSFYCENEDTIVYTPSGKDILNGLYVRMLYAYQIHDIISRNDKDYIEEYKFYLCSDELGAVTFHNLSVTDTVKKQYGDTKENEVSVYSKAETLQSGAMTVKGFQIDISQNPTVKYIVKKNGRPHIVPKSGIVDQTGRYDITLRSAVGTEKEVTLYVDSEKPKDSLERYFGESFIKGKRIFSEGKYPVFEAGLSFYNIMGLDDTFVPISGTISNNTTGNTISVPASKVKKSKVLNEPGEYTAIFTTSTGTSSGDTKEFTFRFSLIAKGTAPGPVINQDSLQEYCKTNISDSYPMYYGVTYQSASKGYITIAFANKSDAVDYARNYEKGMVEVQKDGSYRYNGSLKVSQKEKIDSNWDLTDAINYFAENAVTKSFFDMSDSFTYCTLKDSNIAETKNLRTLELDRSVVIFGSGQKDTLASCNTLPVISSKKYFYLTPGIAGKTEMGKNDFQFVKDKYGCDSNKIVITDCDNKRISIEYNKGVGAQLQKAGCSSGVVTITESTVYGDTAEYQAIFIKENENTSKVDLSYYSGGKEYLLTVSAGNCSIPSTVDAFSILGVTDPLDEYSLVLVSKDNMEYEYVSDQVLKEAWSTPGTYHVKIINRLGHSFTFDVNVADSDYAAISFKGAGTDSIKDIIAYFNQTDVELPTLERYGYVFNGYTDQNGDSYSNRIPVIMTKSPIILTANWTPKRSQLIIKDSNGHIIKTRTVDFGSKINLNDEISPEGYNVTAWKIGDKETTSDKIYVDSENEIILTAIVENIPNPMESVTNQTEQIKAPSEAKKSFPTWIIILIIAAGVILALLIFKGIISARKKAVTKDQADNVPNNMQCQSEHDGGGVNGEEND